MPSNNYGLKVETAQWKNLNCSTLLGLWQIHLYLEKKIVFCNQSVFTTGSLKIGKTVQVVHVVQAVEFIHET